jgi:hypothetical protein
VNIRSEAFGKDFRPAVDLKMSVDIPNTSLEVFDSALLAALYFKAKPEEQQAGAQETLEGVDPISDVPNLRLPKLVPPLKWNAELSGYTLTIDYGAGGKSNIVMAGCLVNSFALEPKEGGTVNVQFRVQCNKDLTEKILGKLATLVQHDVWITLEAPEEEPQLPNVDGQQSPEDALAATGGES